MAIAVPHGPENAPPGCEQPAAVMSHEPHMHLIFIPICRVRSEGCCAPAGTSKSGRVANPISMVAAIRGPALVMALSQSNGRSNRVRQRLRGGLRCARQN